MKEEPPDFAESYTTGDDDDDDDDDGDDEDDDEEEDEDDDDGGDDGNGGDDDNLTLSSPNPTHYQATTMKQWLVRWRVGWLWNIPWPLT